MGEWQQYRLIDVLDALIDYRGKTPKKTSFGVPLITAKIIKNGRIYPPTEYISFSDYDSWMVRGFPKIGDVVLTTEAPLGEVAQLDNATIALAQRVVTLRGKSGVLDNAYLKYYFLSNVGKQRLKARETGTTVTGIKQSELKEVIVDVPPYDTQQKIASILSSLDDKIEVNRKINENLEQQAQALFKSWFVDFEPFKNGEFVESELGMIPKGWRVGKLSEIADYVNGLAMQKFRPQNNEQGLPVLKIKELGQGSFDANTEQCSPSLIGEKYIIHDGDIIFSWSGTLMVKIWCGGLCGLNQHLFVVVPKNYPKWFVYLWTLYHLDNFIRIAKDKAVTMGHIKRGELDKALVAIPDKDEMEKCDALIAPIFKQIISNEIESRRLASLRDTLLP
ncbi:MAG: restriction endonuclease subunit S, partial [Prevotella sp.]|nr:restriction endonuclease subunit S [Prevotella sp.]